MRTLQFPMECCSCLGVATEILTVGREHRPILGGGFLQAVESPPIPVCHSCHGTIKKGRTRQLVLVGLMAALGVALVVLAYNGVVPGWARIGVPILVFTTPGVIGLGLGLKEPASWHAVGPDIDAGEQAVLIPKFLNQEYQDRFESMNPDIPLEFRQRRSLP